jgi:hypothetical protein
VSDDHDAIRWLCAIATSRLTNPGRLLIFLHGQVVGVVEVESFQRFSTNDLGNQVFNCRLGGVRIHPNLLVTARMYCVAVSRWAIIMP